MDEVRCGQQWLLAKAGEGGREGERGVVNISGDRATAGQGRGERATGGMGAVCDGAGGGRGSFIKSDQHSFRPT